MEQTNNRKRTAVFISAVIIIEQLIRYGANAILMTFMQSSESFDYERYNLISRIVSICLTVVTIALTFAAGYILTKDKKKTVIFVGSVYFGRSAAGILESLISSVANSLSYTGLLGGSDASTVIFVGGILVIPLVILVTFFAFTAFEGVNPKLEGSLDSSEMLLSRARKRMLVACIISALVVGVLESAPSLIYAYGSAFFDIDSKYSTIVSVVSLVVKWIGTVIGFAIIYYAGYKPYKSHCDALAFMSASVVSSAISGFVLSVVILPVSVLSQSAEKSGNYSMMMVLTTVMSVVALIGAVAEILFKLYMLRFFFAPMKIILFEQNAEEAAELSQCEAELSEALAECEAATDTEEAAQETPEEVLEEVTEE